MPQAVRRTGNYRVYNTSMAVNDDGTTSPLPVIDPLATQQLQLKTSNTIIGIHLLVSTEWDANPGELFSIRDDKLIPASQFLYNATDGQFFIEQVELVDNADSWFDADVLVFANWSMRANTLGSIRGFLNPCLCTGIRLHRETDYKTYGHEFGHYGFGLQDEYSYLDDMHPRCTASITDPTIADFGSNQPKASCIMASASLANKLCSERPENPHMGWTLQGTMSCWTQLSMTYFDNGGRWTIKTPVTRRAIPGTLPNLLSGWAPRVEIRNIARARLCQPFDLPTVTDIVGHHPIGNFEIWNTTFYGHSFIEGNTTMDNPLTPEDEGGNIRVTGVHVGDILTGRGGVRFDVPSCTQASLRGPQNLRTESALFNPSPIELKLASLLEVSDRFGLERQKEAYDLISGPEPFNLTISFVPTSSAGQAEVRVAAEVKLDQTPEVLFNLIGRMESQKVTMEFDETNKMYVGVVQKLPVYTQANIRVRASVAKRVVDRFVSVSLSPTIAKGLTELGSADGRLALTIPYGVLPFNSYVAIGPAAVLGPSLAEGVVILAGPFDVLASSAMQLSQPIVLRFQLPVGPEKSKGGSAFESGSFEIRHYNPLTKAWEAMGGVFAGANIVSVSTKQLGAYLLVARLTAPVKMREKGKLNRLSGRA
jgi:hypothetical protein